MLLVSRAKGRKQAGMGEEDEGVALMGLGQKGSLGRLAGRNLGVRG